MKTVHGIPIDLTRDSLFDANGLLRMRESYMLESESSPQERFAYVSTKFSSHKAHAQRLYDYASRHWLSYSTPILSYGRSKNGLPISCFLSYIPDTSTGLVDTLSEVNWLSMLGGGVGIGVGIRSSDDKSVGVIPHLKTYEACSLAYRQGRTRRGSYAAYLDISHPDILQFVDIRKPTGDPNSRCMNLHHGINVSDKFMQLIEKCCTDPGADDTWELVDPHSVEVVGKVSAKELWQKILETRMMTGEPYLHFIDTANRALPKHLKDRGLSIKQSNICAEIELPTDKDRTAVCCLSSLNLDYYDEWKDNQLFFEDVARMLDNVLTCFIDGAPASISRASLSAFRERSIGVGALGFHSYLQKKNIPFDSFQGLLYSNSIFANIRKRLDAANTLLGSQLGSAPDYGSPSEEGYQCKRFSHLMAIAPNASTSIIMGNTSPSIEPFRANAYRQDTLSGAFLNRNRNLEALLSSRLKGEELDDVWSSIISHDGSVQHLDCLSDEEKSVFKTAIEIDQRWIVKHAAARQVHVDQGQSINLFFLPDCNVKYLHQVHMDAWKSGLKSLYYCRSEKVGKADKVARSVERKVIEEIATGVDCVACEG